MTREPYQSARRVFWIMDNCSAHRGQKAVDRLRSPWPNVVLVHTPVHASWLNKIAMYFSIVQRKVLTPNDFKSLHELEQRLLADRGGIRFFRMMQPVTKIAAISRSVDS